MKRPTKQNHGVSVARRSRGRQRAGLTVPIAVAALLFTACEPQEGQSPEAGPLEVPTAALDPAIAALIESTLAEVRQAPKSGDAWGKLGSVLMHYEMIDQARRAFNEAERLSPREARWPYLHGVLLMAYDAEAAMRKLKRGAELAPAVSDMPRLRLAEFLAERGHLEEARGHFEKLLQMQPEHPRALLGLARLGLQQGAGAYEKTGLSAIRNRLGPCLTNVHTARSAHVLLATVERALGNAGGAEAAATLAGQLPPDQPWPDPYWEQAAAYHVGRKAMAAKAAAFMDQGRPGEAMAVVGELTAQYPDDDEGWYLAGWGLNQQRQWREAELALREHLRRSPQSPKGLAQLAVSLLNQKRYPEAIEVLERGLKIKSTWRELHYNLGYACVQVGRTNEGIGHLRNALARDPAYAPTYTALAELLNQTGQVDEAHRLLAQAAALFPHDQRVQALARRLAR